MRLLYNYERERERERWEFFFGERISTYAVIIAFYQRDEN